MPFAGSAPNKTFSRTTGLQSGTSAWANTESAGRGIESTDHDTHDQDMAGAINTSLQKNGDNSPTANIDWGGYKIVNLADPSANQEAATKKYVDDTAQGFTNVSVVAATTANITISTDLENGDTIDGVTLATNDLVLVKDQSTASENGIYKVVVSGAASRDTAYDTWAENVGLIVNVSGGSTNASTSWRSAINSSGTINTDDITFVSFGTSLSLPVPVASGGTGATTAAAGFSALKQAATDAATGVVQKATAAQIQAATAGVYAIAADNAASAANEVALTDGATITIDFSAGFNFGVTLAGNRTLAASNYSSFVGRSGYIRFTQDAGGSRTLDTSASPWVNPGGSDIVLSTAAGAVDLVFYQIVSIGGSAKILLSIQKAIS